MATFNHTRGDSPRTPCAKCALECGWVKSPYENALICPNCKGHIGVSWLDEASAEGVEHVCVAPKAAGVAMPLDNGPITSHLRMATDDQLQAECDRRGKLTSVTVYRRMADAERDRDEWKRRAEAAEAAQALILARREPRPLAVWANETGPGIAALKPDNSVAHLDEDLLCDDA